MLASLAVMECKIVLVLDEACRTTAWVPEYIAVSSAVAFLFSLRACGESLKS